MHRPRSLAIWFVAVLSVVFASPGCRPGTDAAAPQQPAPKPLFVLSLTSGTADPGRAVMGLMLAEAALDDGRKVVVFLSYGGPELAKREEATAPFVAGKRVEAARDPDELPSPKELLRKLIGRGAKVLVCPVCMKFQKITEASLVDGAVASTREKLFASLPPGATVFSY